MTNEEKNLLQRLKSGALDGIVGDLLETTGGSTVWYVIKNGIPIQYKKGLGGSFLTARRTNRLTGCFMSCING